MNVRSFIFLIQILLIAIPQPRSWTLKKCGLRVGHFVLNQYFRPQGSDADRRQTGPETLINRNIKVSPIRLIVPGNSSGEEVMAGIFPLTEAIQKAEELELDLVLINDKGDPPVCKIIDFGKYKYQLELKKKENMKKQVKQDIKEVKMSYKIDQHDIDVRTRAIQKFLGDGDRVYELIN